MEDGAILRESGSLRIVSGKPVNLCQVLRPRFTQKETELLDAVNKLALQDISPAEITFLVLENKERGRFLEMVDDFIDRVRSAPPFPPEGDRERVRGYIEAFLDKAAPYVRNRKDVREEIMRMVAGVGKLTPLMEDEGLEEIMVNGAKKPVYVFDTRHGHCRTSLTFESDEEIIGIIKKISDSLGRGVGRENPLLDARLPDGSRINATVPPVSVGATLTIRKFRRTPFTILDIIERGTISYELAAFLWMCTEGMGIKPANVIIAGGSGCGKTTTLNALSVFLPPKDRIITIEDTLELNFSHRDNWVQLEAKPGKEGQEITIEELLRNAIRMRPDRVIVGEVRGREAEDLFVAMDIGIQGCMGTLHANSAKETLLRLMNPPMSVPRSMFVLLDLIVMQHRIYMPGRGMVRRVAQVSEVSMLGDDVVLNDIYSLDRQQDRVVRTDVPSEIVESLAFHTGLKKQGVEEEMGVRAGLLRYMAKNNVNSYEGIQKIVSEYVEDPSKVLRQIS